LIAKFSSTDLHQQSSTSRTAIALYSMPVCRFQRTIPASGRHEIIKA
jgi:hypothetical protein